MNPNDTESQIIEILRELKPYEVIEITKDQLGRPNYYIVRRSQKVIISQKVDKRVAYP